MTGIDPAAQSNLAAALAGFDAQYGARPFGFHHPGVPRGAVERVEAVVEAARVVLAAAQGAGGDDAAAANEQMCAEIYALLERAGELTGGLVPSVASLLARHANVLVEIDRLYVKYEGLPAALAREEARPSFRVVDSTGHPGAHVGEQWTLAAAITESRRLTRLLGRAFEVQRKNADGDWIGEPVPAAPASSSTQEGS